MARILSRALFLICLLAIMSSCSHRNSSVRYPAPLRSGDKIAIVSPAGPIDSALVDSAVITLRSIGFNPVVYPNALGRNGHFSGTHSERLADLSAALTDPSVRAILCSRGGYGAALILDSLSLLPLEKDPKWIIGFSDISALHSLMSSRGIASIHASMAKQLALGADDADNQTLIGILKGNLPSYSFPSHPYNHLGTAEGRLQGGNLAVIQALIGTPYNIIQPGTILFIEDVSEPIYKIERILYQLRMSGVIENLKGLIIGQFTDYKSDDNFETMEDMIAAALADYPDLPVAFNLPIGHVDHNVPIVESANAKLVVGPDSVTLEFAK